MPKRVTKNPFFHLPSGSQILFFWNSPSSSVIFFRIEIRSCSVLRIQNNVARSGRFVRSATSTCIALVYKLLKKKSSFSIMYETSEIWLSQHPPWKCWVFGKSKLQDRDFNLIFFFGILKDQWWVVVSKITTSKLMTPYYIFWSSLSLRTSLSPQTALVILAANGYCIHLFPKKIGFW